MSLSQRIWFITGTSSGLGRHLVKSALARNDKVIATARSLSNIQDLQSDSCVTLRLDVDDGSEAIEASVKKALGIWGKVDVVVNNAGIGQFSLTEEGGEAMYMKQFRTNFFGPLNVTNAFLPHMRKRREGTVVFVGSRSSWRSRIPMIGAYVGSKAALTAAAESLAAEVSHLNIRVLNVLPGGLRTENWAKAQITDSTEPSPRVPAPHWDNLSTEEMQKMQEDYALVREPTVKWMRGQDGTQIGDPHKAAEAIVGLVRGEIKGESGEGWTELLVLGEDAENDIREKCDAVVKNLDEWKNVTRSIAFN